MHLNVRDPARRDAGENRSHIFRGRALPGSLAVLIWRETRVRLFRYNGMGERQGYPGREG